MNMKYVKKGLSENMICAFCGKEGGIFKFFTPGSNPESRAICPNCLRELQEEMATTINNHNIDLEINKFKILQDNLSNLRGYFIKCCEKVKETDFSTVGDYIDGCHTGEEAFLSWIDDTINLCKKEIADLQEKLKL